MKRTQKHSGAPFLLSIATLVLALAVCVSAGDKKKQTYYVKPDQTADLEKPHLTIARQKCENWAIAAGLETMLKQQDVNLDQSFWVMRLNRGEICVNDLPSMEALADVVNGEFVLQDGRHVQLELQFSPGAPRDVDSLIVGLKQQRSSIVLFRGHAYYLTGMTYDEYIGNDGSRMFPVKELRLANTFAQQPGLTFQRGRDNMDDIQGTLSVSVEWL